MTQVMAITCFIKRLCLNTRKDFSQFVSNSVSFATIALKRFEVVFRSWFKSF